jgi:cytochrome P450
LPDGHAVKKGDMVNYQPYPMGRMKFLWGDDAEEFRPERWLDDDGVFVPESPFKFTAFQVRSLFIIVLLHYITNLNQIEVSISRDATSLASCSIIQAGPRICLGKEFAYRQMKIFAAVLLYMFRFEMWERDSTVGYRPMLTLKMDGPLYVRAIPRRSSAQRS